MPISGDGNRFFKVTVRGQLLGAATSNTFYYRQALPLQSDAQDVAGLFVLGPLLAMRNIQTVSQTYQEVEAIDTRDVANFFTLAIALSGQIPSANPMSSFTAMSWRLLRSSRDMRSGWKRLGGVDEGDVTGNTFLPAHFTAMQAAAPGIGGNLVDGIATLQLCIVRDRPTAGDPGIDPDDSTTWRYTDVASTQAVNRTTSQNSRKTF